MTADDRAGVPVVPVRGRGYQVTVAGVLGPVLQAALADLRPARQPPSSLLRLQVPDGWTAGDVAAVLQAQGLELLTLRRVADPYGDVGQRSATSS
jgi:hypothetical protein